MNNKIKYKRTTNTASLQQILPVDELLSVIFNKQYENEMNAKKKFHPYRNSVA